ncbi:DMT family transporter [Paracoccaceae bacterium]|nr:DMT family transporter [Paracoccaceae bacterium]
MIKLLNKKWNGIAIVLLSSFFFAFVPTSAKLALDNGVSLMVLLMSRCLIGLIILSQLTKSLGHPILVDRGKFLPLIFVSIISVCLIASTYHAIEYISIALVLMIIYLFPIGVALITTIRGEESLGRTQWLCIIGVLLGLGILILDEPSSTSLYGIFISVIGLLLFIIFIYFTGKLVDEIGSATINLHLSFFSMIVLIIYISLVPVELSLPDNSIGWFGIIGNGVFYVLSYVLFFIGSKSIGITTASVLALTEPLFATIVALFILNQYLSLQEFSGFFVTICFLSLFLIFAPNVNQKN